MLADLKNTLGIVINALAGIASMKTKMADKKWAALGLDLLELHLAINKIVQNGNEIVSVLEIVADLNVDLNMPSSVEDFDDYKLQVGLPRSAGFWWSKDDSGLTISNQIRNQAIALTTALNKLEQLSRKIDFFDASVAYELDLMLSRKNGRLMKMIGVRVGQVHPAEVYQNEWSRALGTLEDGTSVNMGKIGLDLTERHRVSAYLEKHGPRSLLGAIDASNLRFREIIENNFSLRDILEASKEL